MKLALRVLSLVILAGVATFYISCSKNDGPGKSDQDAQIEKLNGVWAVEASNDVTFNGSAASEDFTGFSLDIDGTAGQDVLSYVVSGNLDPSPWPSSGTFTFGSNVKETLNRDDGAVISYDVTDTQLILDFNYSDPNGRVASVEGSWKFILTKQ